MSICETCEREMTTNVGCTASLVRFPDGKIFHRSNTTLCGEHKENKCCHDCGSPPYGLHHTGCDNESCPRCGGQLFICECNFISATEYITVEESP